MNRLNLIDLKQIKITDSFWRKHTKLVKDQIIKYQWEAMNDRIDGAPKSHCIENFRIAAGEAEGEFYGAVFQDSDLAKWLEAVAYVLAEEPDEELQRQADEVIDLIGRAQQPDGYFNTYFILKEPGQRFRNLCEGHELYTLGHMIEAAVAYYQATGKRQFLEIVCRMADLVAHTFGSGKCSGYPGHQEIELALVRLYEVTGKREYLDTAKFFIDARGAGENYFLAERQRPDYNSVFPEFADYQPAYSQSHLPVREQKTAEGHAVRAVYMYCAMADLAALYDDAGLLKACETLWNNIVNRRMYVTGSIGSSGILERFTTDYDLPNDCNYSESCASIGLALFGRRMQQITKDAHYIDIVERALYNTVLAGISLSGQRFFYVNPLEVWPDNCLARTSKEHVKSSRQKWFGVACCPPNIARTLAAIGQYIYTHDENTIYVNLFIGNEAHIALSGGPVHLSMQSAFPQRDEYHLTVETDNEGAVLALRIPDYAKNYQIFVNGNQAEFQAEKGYAYLAGDIRNAQIQVLFQADARFVRANPKVRADGGKICVMKGPFVYALEEIDNGANLAAVYADTSTAPAVCWDEELFGGIYVAKFHGMRLSEKEWGEELYGEYQSRLEPVELTAVPYPYWNNRGSGEMMVWIKEKI